MQQKDKKNIHQTIEMLEMVKLLFWFFFSFDLESQLHSSFRLPLRNQEFERFSILPLLCQIEFDAKTLSHFVQ